ncbi:hypothetical protein BSFA1_57980 [Burkholderia sp. SFA1]|uniref:hypothetical protein n=1 Tax=Caballeronia sp. CLC5 TaxID=2906764 RepID=UPI001F1AB08E|nr:hypothetical protein [Caballeronia sp. CLC5]MCE4573823.1 hypothetical protein [Caballeronia sp. CLC5]BBQ00670.1 hypothetical protein BSFA1_57980 [Burkholderia sp. SFA1]
MHRLLIGVTVASCVITTGCGTIISTMSKGSDQLVGAKPLSDPKLLIIEAKKNNTPDRQVVEERAQESIASCQAFASQLMLTQNTVNTAADITSTILTALATVFTPLTTVHALTAGATVVTGSKTAVASNIYAQASMSGLRAALDKTYFTPMGTYLTQLHDLPADAPINVSSEFSSIQLQHSQCNLASAEVFIDESIKTSTKTSPVPIPQPGPPSANRSAPRPAH